MKKINALLLSAVTILMSVTLMVVGSFALFSDTVTIQNSQQAGELKVTLIRASVVTTNLNASGVTETATDDADKTFEELKNESVFGFSDEDMLIPGMYSEASFVIANESDVAFGYYVKVELDDENNVKLAEQMKVSVVTGLTVSGDETNYTCATNADVESFEKMLSEGLTVGAEDDFIGTVAVGTKQGFSIRLTFDEGATEDYMNLSTAFKVTIYAIQNTAA